jgi:hypothetical protein
MRAATKTIFAHGFWIRRLFFLVFGRGYEYGRMICRRILSSKTRIEQSKTFQLLTAKVRYRKLRDREEKEEDRDTTK